MKKLEENNDKTKDKVKFSFILKKSWPNVLTYSSYAFTVSVIYINILIVSNIILFSKRNKRQARSFCKVTKPFQESPDNLVSSSFNILSIARNGPMSPLVLIEIRIVFILFFIILFNYYNTGNPAF